MDSIEGEESGSAGLIRRAAIVLNPKIKKYKFKEVKNILDSEYPVDEPITDTQMSALCLACSLSDSTEKHQELNEKMVTMILGKEPNLNFKDDFHRTPLHFACSVGNLTAVKILLEKGAGVVDVNSKTTVSKLI